MSSLQKLLQKIWRQQRHFLILALILLLALFLRFYRLGQVPDGLTVDEAAIGYNAYAVFTTRRDEWLVRLPLSFRSFGDYKAPLAIYLLGPFIYFLGSNSLALRLPFACFGLLAIVGFYLLIREIFYQEKKKELLALLAAFLLTVSPWHIHFSRLGFEAGMALTFLIYCFYFLFRFTRQAKLPWLLLAALSGALGFYSYHSIKLTLPLLLLAWLIWQRRFVRRQIKSFLIAVAVTLFLLLPFIYDAFWLGGLTRANSTLFATDLSAWALSNTLLQNLFSYFSLAFLLQGNAGGNLRHSDGAFGVLDYPSLLLLVFYLLRLLWRIVRRQKIPFASLTLFAIYWLFVALLPAIISQGGSHTVRALLALPGLLILVILALFELLSLKQIKQEVLLSFWLLAELFCLALYQRHYYQLYQYQANEAFASGYLEVFNYLKNYDKKGLDKIVFSNDYQHAYIYALFVFRISPIAWQGGILNLFQFSEKIDDGNLQQPNTLVVASNQDQLSRPADHYIYDNNGQIRFAIYLPDSQ